MREGADTIFARTAARYKVLHDCEPRLQRPPRVPGEFALPQRANGPWPFPFDFDSMLRRRLVLLGAALLAACSPELNWREVRTPEAGVEQLFPCKPVRQQRKADLADMERHLVLLVCDAGDVTWAQMHVPLNDKDAIGSSMEALVAAAHANIGAAPAPAPAQDPAPASASASERSGVVTDSSAPSLAQRYRIKGTAPDGRPVEMALKVFSNGSVVVQVSALASVLPTEAVDTFLGSVKVQP